MICVRTVNTVYVFMKRKGGKTRRRILGTRGEKRSENIKEPMSRICEGLCVERIWQMWER